MPSLSFQPKLIAAVLNGVKVYPIEIRPGVINLAGIKLVAILQQWFAVSDGFANRQEFFDFFKAKNYTRPLVWIVWDMTIVEMIDTFLFDERYRQKYNHPLDDDIPPTEKYFPI